MSSSSPSNKQKNNDLRCALSTMCVTDICKTINSALELKFSYVICPIMHPRFKREHILNNLKHRNLPISRSDLVLNTECWQRYVVGKISKFYNCDAEDDIIQRNAELGLIEELKFTSHLNLTAFVIPIRSSKLENFSRIINNFLLNKLVLFNILISVPIQQVSLDDVIENVSNENETEEDDTWHWWCKLRTMCEESARLGLILELTTDLPSCSKLDRWFSEPLKAITIPTSVFLMNKSGYPVLPKAYQQCVLKFFRLEIDIIIEGYDRCGKGLEKYYEYMNYLYKNQPPLDPSTKFTKDYEDCLQYPLQPLMDNLESQIYEIFEKDPCKYMLYQKAIEEALEDRVPKSERYTTEIIIMVMGAGRGPLVKASLAAAFTTERRVKVYAIEKNPNAINTLLNLKKDQWGDRVEIIATDMREWTANLKADIMISELLGSFGCNELSPECLYGAQKFLKDDGISIPYRYRAFIAPIQSYKIYTEMKKCKEYEHPFEAPYVVLLHNHYRIDEPKPIFEFLHPSDATDTTRYNRIEFQAKEDSTIHGIAGYFDCHLYKDVLLSIVPESHSSGLFSWFPMFFPINHPMPIKANDKITIHFWRKMSNRQVWYEWSISTPLCTPVHNPNGRTYWIGL